MINENYYGRNEGTSFYSLLFLLLRFIEYKFIMHVEAKIKYLSFTIKIFDLLYMVALLWTSRWVILQVLLSFFGVFYCGLNLIKLVISRNYLKKLLKWVEKESEQLNTLP